jgi:RNA polymerase sigma factor (sigma-70 family)
MIPIFLMHAEAVNRAARSAARGEGAAAEDATQQAFLESTRIWDKFREWPPASQRTWLSQCAISRVIDGWRRNRRIVPADAIPQVQAVQDPEEIALSRYAAGQALKLIDTLDLRMQRVAFLCWHEGWSDAEIGKHLGISRSTVTRDREKVIVVLKKEMGDELPFSQDGGISDREAQ